MAALIAGLAVAIGVEGRSSKTREGAAPHASMARVRESSPPRRAHGPHGRAVPILMYHVVERPPAGARSPELFVSGRDFTLQMSRLAAAGFHGVTLHQVYEYWRRGIALPRRPIVLSFDDGCESQYRNAFPVLRKLGWPGVLNLVTKNEEPEWGMRPARVRRLIRAGWEIAAHTISHVDLTTLNATSLRREVAGSRRLIRRQFGVPVDFFCYPAGRFDPAVVAAVKAAGYLGATTEQPGLARPDERFILPRVRIDAGDSPEDPLRKVRALGG